MPPFLGRNLSPWKEGKRSTTNGKLKKLLIPLTSTPPFPKKFLAQGGKGEWQAKRGVEGGGREQKEAPRKKQGNWLITIYIDVAETAEK